MNDDWDCCKACDYDYEEDCSHCGCQKLIALEEESDYNNNE